MNNNTSGAGSTVPVFRDLNADDVFDMAEVLKKIGLPQMTELIAEQSALSWEPPMMMKDGKAVPLPREKWTAAQEKAETDYLIAEDRFSAKVLGLIFNNIGSCREEIFMLLADGSGLSVAEIRALPASVFIKAVSDYISREGFRDFFTDALQLLSSMGTFTKS